MDVIIGGKRTRIATKNPKGSGGEAEIFDIGGGRVAKLFKPPTHPDYTGLPAEQEGARTRIATHQRKLRQFPKGLPPHVVAPVDLVEDTAGKVIGYTMPFLANADLLRQFAMKSFRMAGVPNDRVVAILRNLHGTVDAIHRAGVVIADFNDLNVLVRGDEAYCIDADSFQYGSYFTRTFTAQFVDPLLCDATLAKLMLTKPHTAASDWYAFAIMLMQSFLFVGPYGGVYQPKDPKRQLAIDARPLKRITVFHPEVRYPKPAIPYGVLPDDLLQYLHRVFEKDDRGTFPALLLENLRWTTCTQCGASHARAMCPVCAHAAPAAIRETAVVRGTVTATRVFRTSGIILHATMQNGELRWVYHETDAFRREDRSVVLAGALDPQLRYRILGGATLIAKDGTVATLAPNAALQTLAVDQYRGTLPVFDTNASHAYWNANGQLLRDGAIASERIGDVLPEQTLFWVGSAFGFGFYRAGELLTAFVFDAEHRGINDTVQLVPIRGHLLDATCAFTDQRCWFFTATAFGGKTIHRATVIRRDGTIEVTAEADADDGSWLGTIRGKAAAGNFLLAATDDGIVRVESNQGTLATTKTFPDTEPFVDAGSQLFPGKQGLYVVGRNEILLLKIR
ncbi:hypothetical protein HY480_03155 [Candidatus Uhrbacteria bacterium]|nr:hypothetical protein [Candidatus Uhrbacteria bacterium]